MRREAGSTMPLQIGLAVAAIALTFGLAEASSMSVVHSRADSDARYAAVQVIRNQGDIPALPDFDYGPAIQRDLPEAESVKVQTSDGKTFDAQVCYLWRSPFLLHADQIICATAKVRRVPV